MLFIIAHQHKYMLEPFSCIVQIFIAFTTTRSFTKHVHEWLNNDFSPNHTN